MEEKIKNYFILALIVVIGVLFMTKGCGTSPLPESVLKPKIDTIINHTDTIVKWKDRIVTKYLTIYAPIKKVPTRDTNGLYLCNSLNTYRDSLIDSNISIYNEQVVRGELSKAQTTYKLHLPVVFITHTISIIDSIPVLKYRQYCYSFYGGIRMGANASTFSQISPYIAVRKDGIYLDYSYNILNSSHNIGLGFNLFNIK